MTTSVENIIITGTLRYIDEYKKLHFTVSDADDIEKIKKCEELSLNGKMPYWVSPLNVMKLRVNLTKYERPYVAKYERMLKKEFKCVLKVNTYESDDYGHGVVFSLLKIL
jgi:hypothetical protein